MSPLCTQKGRHIGILLITQFVPVRSVLSIMQAVKHVTLTQCRTIVGPIYDAEPTLAQYWVTGLCLTPRCMWASVTDGGPT